MIEAVAEQAGSQDPMILLEAAVRFAGAAGEAADAMVDHHVAAARAAGVSWTVIGQRLGSLSRLPGSGSPRDSDSARARPT